MRRYYIFFTVIGVVSLAMLSYQIVLSHRARHDDIVTSDLDSIRTSIETYATNHKSLPSDLSQLTDLCTGSGSVQPNSQVAKDCTTARLSQYHYSQQSSSKYQICATFYIDSGAPVASSTSTDFSYVSFSDHGKGNQCFTITPTALINYQAMITTAPVDQNLVLCKATYQAVDPREPISAIDVPGGSISFVTTTTISSVATPGTTATPKTESITTIRRWNVEPAVYDSACNKISASSLKVGDRVSLYYDNLNRSFVTAIQRLN